MCLCVLPNTAAVVLALYPRGHLIFLEGGGRTKLQHFEGGGDGMGRDGLGGCDEVAATTAESRADKA